MTEQIMSRPVIAQDGNVYEQVTTSQHTMWHDAR